ncbi:family 43 glycosylhydrolase [Herbiconiux sp.]|uniref:family 43 glycosylhydrolase n=1 Tax=Herbiconiux sp. TaxID=1871186 RepID=UPI0025BDA687|nr:family 43 glycosylhydrolase [Herbiconiux sp.]
MTRPSFKALVAATAVALTVPLLSATPAFAEPADHLVAHYALDETTGSTAVDSSGKGHDAQIAGAPVLGGDAGLTLDGVDDHVALPNDILAGLDSITVSTEVLVRGEQGTPYFVFGLGNPATSSSGTGYLFATGNTYRAGITTGNWSGEQVVGSDANLARDTWKTLTYTLDDASDTARLYLDGAEVAVKTGVTVKPGELGGGTTTANYIGRSNYASDRYLAGSVRDFRLYDTALSATEVAALQPSDEVRLARDAEQLTLGDLSAVQSDLVLPGTGLNGSTVTWSSDAPGTISTTGAVTRPEAGQSDATVTLTATLARGTGSTTKDFTATVLALPDDQSEVDSAATALVINTLDDVRGNLTLPAAPEGISLEWTSSDPSIVSVTGEVTRPEADTAVTLTAQLGKGSATATRTFTAQVKKAADLAAYEGYAFAYFTGNSLAGENIYFAASEGNNALDWKELNGGRPALSSTEGTKGLRDPFVIRSPEGDKFYLIATDLSIGSGTSWGDSVRTGSKYIEVWESSDLKNWSAQRHVKVAPDNAGMTWAPEAYYDDTIGSYVVFWASALYGDDDPGHTGATYHRMMYATTRDFVTFSTPEVWQDQGVSRIDSTVIEESDVYYRFTKDEGAGGTGCSDIIQESSTDLRATLDSWTVMDSCIGRDAGTSAVEGPTAFKANPGDVNGDKFYLFVDEYGGRGYIPLATDDIAHPDWKVAADYDLPASPRHGTVIPVTADELAALSVDEPVVPPAPANEDGEIVRYDFSDGSGSVLHDVSGNGQDGSIQGGATFADGALLLDGGDDYVDLPDNLLAGVVDTTVEADVWINSGQATPYFIYGLGNTVSGAGNGYLFSTGNGYRTSLATGNWTTEQTVAQGGDLPRGRWAHLTYVLKDTTATIYLDGIAVASGTVTTDPGDIGQGVTTANHLGKSNYDGDRLLNGRLRGFAIYNRALSDAEVLAASGNTSALAGVTLAEDVLKTAPIVDSAAHTVVFPVKPGTDRSALTPQFATAAGVQASPASGTTADLREPVTVTLTSAGADPVTWTLSAIEMGSPSIPGLYADPNIVAFGDTYYIYATTDGFPGWGGKEFFVWSSKDLVDWTRSETPILTLDGADGNVPWATGNAWAPTIAEKDGKYYFYFSGHNAELDRKTIGVAVADSPTGPFVAQPEAMILNDEAVTSGQAIDPAAFTDPETGKHYLFWGNGSPVYAELSDDMLSIKAETLKPISGLTDFREGTFLNYRDGLYHLTYSIDDTGSANYKVGYATATSVDGPWTYRGVLLQKDTTKGILATGHNSVLNVPGTDDWYIAYHRFAIPGGDGQHRETTIDELTFDPATGLMQTVTPTLESVAPQTIVTAPVEPEVGRIGGADRFEVSANTSKAGWPDGSSTVYVASGEVFPDALSAASAATVAGAPILLARSGAVPAAVKAEIQRLGATDIVIVGGPNTIGAGVEAELAKLGAVTRIGGADRFEASRNIAEHAFPDGAEVAVLATGLTFPDALSAGAAVAGRGPVILVNGGAAGLDAATKALLTDLGVDEIAVAGGTNSVSTGIQSDAAKIADTVRLGGADRFEASRTITAHFVTSAKNVLLATGSNFPDALSGSAFGPRTGAPLFTVQGSCIPAETLAQITALGAEQITLLGGPNTLSPAVEQLQPCAG